MQRLTQPADSGGQGLLVAAQTALVNRALSRRSAPMAASWQSVSWGTQIP
jgi:hypothetical protein